MKIRISCCIVIMLPAILFGKTYTHPEYLYNQAIDYYNKEEIGTSMYYTKQAFLLAPYNDKIRTLLFRIRQDIGMPKIFSSDSFLNRSFAKLFYHIPPYFNALLGSLIFLIASILVTLLSLKKLSFTHSNTITNSLFIISGILLLQALGHYYLFFDKDYRVLIFDTTLYEEPSLESKFLDTLPAGTELTVIDSSDEFILVQSLDGRESWVQTNNAPRLFPETISPPE